MTIDKLQDHLAVDPVAVAGMFCKKPLPAVVCVDGTTLSVQASEHTYCEPRSNYGPWASVEVGYPSVAPPASWDEYKDDPGATTETVWGYIPIRLVAEFIDSHGGMA